MHNTAPSFSFTQAPRASEAPEAHCQQFKPANADSESCGSTVPVSQAVEQPHSTKNTAVFASTAPRFPEQRKHEGDALDLDPWAPNELSRASRATRAGAPGFASTSLGASNPRAALSAAAAANIRFEIDTDGVHRPGCFFDASKRSTLETSSQKHDASERRSEVLRDSRTSSQALQEGDFEEAFEDQQQVDRDQDLHDWAAASLASEAATQCAWPRAPGHAHPGSTSTNHQLIHQGHPDLSNQEGSTSLRATQAAQDAPLNTPSDVCTLNSVGTTALHHAHNQSAQGHAVALRLVQQPQVSSVLIVHASLAAHSK